MASTFVVQCANVCKVEIHAFDNISSIGCIVTINRSNGICICK